MDRCPGDCFACGAQQHAHHQRPLRLRACLTGSQPHACMHAFLQVVHAPHPCLRRSSRRCTRWRTRACAGPGCPQSTGPGAGGWWSAGSPGASAACRCAHAPIARAACASRVADRCRQCCKPVGRPCLLRARGLCLEETGSCQGACLCVGRPAGGAGSGSRRCRFPKEGRTGMAVRVCRPSIVLTRTDSGALACLGSPTYTDPDAGRGILTLPSGSASNVDAVYRKPVAVWCHGLLGFGLLNVNRWRLRQYISAHYQYVL